MFLGPLKRPLCFRTSDPCVGMSPCVPVVCWCAGRAVPSLAPTLAPYLRDRPLHLPTPYWLAVPSRLHV